jgi:copper(I)-binding protein
MMNYRRFSVLFALLISLAAPARADIEIHDAWVRAMPPGSAGTAGYLRLVNNGSNAVTVVGASSDIAERTQLHESVAHDGVVSMSPLPRLPVAPGAEVSLEPGGRHLMLMGLTAAPREGATVRLCLQLASGDEQCVDTPVRRGEGGGHHHH